MSLPNYSPSGAISFGAVPWGASYSDVRLYSSLSEQHADIASMMTVTSTDYAYIGRNRRIKVAIEADRLYHVNYCMYRNESLTDGWIYCFVTDVRYVNDNTTEVTIETDVFQTYLYGTDWTMPACLVERETVSSEDDASLLTNEADFSLVYVVDNVRYRWFRTEAYAVMSSADAKEDQSVVQPVLNPTGWYADAVNMGYYKGVPEGCNIRYFYADTTSGGSESLEHYLTGMSRAGSTDSIVAVYPIVDIPGTGLKEGWQTEWTRQDVPTEWMDEFDAPEWGTKVDGYEPHNRKLLYYPYTFCRLTDMNGSSSDLRYELLDNLRMCIKYSPTPSCKALVYPFNYRNTMDFESGIVANCGTLGSWSNSAFQNWLGQHSGTIALAVAGIALAGLTGGTSIAAAATEASAASSASGALAGLSPALGAAAAGAEAAGATGAGLAAATGAFASNVVSSPAALGIGAGLAHSIAGASRQPTTTRGQTSSDLSYATGVQGVAAERICVKRELARQIDQYFDMFGYDVERVKEMELFSRPSWNYVKTVGCTPRSANVGSDSTAPFSRGRGTPASALAVIKRAFDSGITMWHTTSGFGNHLLDNTL